MWKCFYLNFIKFLLNVSFVLPVNFSYFTPIPISDSWGYGTTLLSLSKSRLRKLRNNDMDIYLVIYITIWLDN